ncbi:MAG: LysM peptidoglycan-binding domain-containing protein, partial [Chitinophagia bacterium]|nr:LysM peptidoglycan-binding domain-containing protein [Chitinophagia bacterium]
NSQAAVTTATQATTLPITTTTAAADTAAAPDALTALKGELDKVVYTDDSKLLPPPGAGKHYPITISVAPDGSTGDEGSEPTPQHKAAPKAHSKGGGSLYTVKKGDTIGAIADANGVSIKQIMRLNKVQARALRPGQKLRIR